MADHPELKALETKVVILGHTGVGKTSMVNQYVRGQFSGNTTATIGAAFMKKEVQVNNWNITLQIWDTAGQERFRSMAPMYYRGAHAAILVFDVSSQETLDKVSGWVEELQGHANEDSVLVLAANKCDLRSVSPDTCVSLEKAQAYARTIGATVFETSAKTGRGVEELFDHVAKNLLKNEIAKRKMQEVNNANNPVTRSQAKSFKVNTKEKQSSASSSQSSSCC